MLFLGYWDGLRFVGGLIWGLRVVGVERTGRIFVRFMGWVIGVVRVGVVWERFFGVFCRVWVIRTTRSFSSFNIKTIDKGIT